MNSHLVLGVAVAKALTHYIAATPIPVHLTSPLDVKVVQLPSPAECDHPHPLREKFAKAVTSGGLPLIGAIATLLSFVHLRSAHLSNGARGSIAELLYSRPIHCSTALHAKSLETQADQFLMRCIRMNVAFVLLGTSIFPVIFAIFLCGVCEAFWEDSGLVCLSLGLLLIFSALCFAACEFARGAVTLRLHIYSALDRRAQAEHLLELLRVSDRSRRRPNNLQRASDDESRS
jgi:hypothetical protein